MPPLKALMIGGATLGAVMAGGLVALAASSGPQQTPPSSTVPTVTARAFLHPHQRSRLAVEPLRPGFLRL